MNNKSRKQVGTWLLTGVFMIVIQILLGGITRLTGSGLSITEWNLILGSVPPMNHDQWQQAFEQYKLFPQYRLMNYEMSLSGFKNIYWWEFIHRLWARLFIPVFFIPLVFFLVSRKISKTLLAKLAIAFLLGGLQGLMGWIMVKSGLIDRPWVNAIDLSVHLILALILLCYLTWLALEVLRPLPEKENVSGLKFFIVLLSVLLFIQIFYGGLMAGNHAALFYPTFPKIGSQWVPENLFSNSPPASNFFQNIAMIQLLHRSIGLLIASLILIFYFIARRKVATAFFSRILMLLPLLVIAQVLLGIFTLLNSLGKIPIALAAAHQMCAVLLLLAITILLYQIFASGKIYSATVYGGKPMR